MPSLHVLYCFSFTMPAKFRLYYFDTASLGEVPRMLFALADVEYEDIRFSLGNDIRSGIGGEEWNKKYKPSKFFSAQTFTLNNIICVYSISAEWLFRTHCRLLYLYSEITLQCKSGWYLLKILRDVYCLMMLECHNSSYI